MYPILFHFGPITIYSFGAFMVLAALSAAWVVSLELKRRGYELDAVLPGWLEMGALVTMDSQRPSHLIPRRTSGRQSKHLIFKRDVLDPADGDS